MKEQSLSHYLSKDYFSSGYISSEEPEENNFHSVQVKSENIFCEPNKENTEQLSSKILCFPFKLDSYELVNLINKNQPELGGEQLLIIFGSLENLKENELILKLIFNSKDKNSSLDLRDFVTEIKTLINLGLEFVGVFQNKLFIKYENENMTKEAYISLQQSSSLFDLLYEEERDFNSLEEQTKNNSCNNLHKKTYKQNLSIEDKKKENIENLDFKFNFEKNKLNLNNKLNEIKNVNYNINNNAYIKEDINLNNDSKSIWFNNINNSKVNNNFTINTQKNVFLQNNKIDEFSKQQQTPQKMKNPNIFTPQICPQFFVLINNLQKSQQINPILLMQMLKSNPLFIQNNLAFQNYLKLLLQSQLNNINNNNNININNDKINLKNFTQKINNNEKMNFYINSNMNKNNNFYPLNNNEPSTNSNSSSSSKDSSPILNYSNQNITNFKIESNNINDMININNNNIAKKIDNNYNLKEIILNKQYKEYIPKNIQEKVQFSTNSTRDYQFKYVSRYIVQIENEKNFPVTKMIIGNNGMLLRKILLDNCIKYGDHTTKIRLRGRGSGYKEGPKNEESKDPMELCISSLNMASFSRCSIAIENMLLQVYYQYYLYQCKNFLEKKNQLNNKMESPPIAMKKILRYHYVVNRYNTLLKEEKRRKKEEEAKKV